MPERANQERREDGRHDSLNLLGYTPLDDAGNPGRPGMARTLNVSSGGIMVETTTSFDAGQILQLDIGLENDLVQIRGRVIHCEQRGAHYRVGLEFLEMDDSSRDALNSFLAAFETAAAAPGAAS